MKVMIMLLVAVFCFVGIAFAEPIDFSDAIDKIPVEEVKEGVLFSFDDNKLKAATSYSLIGNLMGVEELSLDLGSIFEDNEVILTLSYDLINLKEDLNVTAWIFDLIEISITAGYGIKQIGVDNECDPLIGLGLIKFKF